MVTLASQQKRKRKEKKREREKKEKRSSVREKRKGGEGRGGKERRKKERERSSNTRKSRDFFNDDAQVKFDAQNNTHSDANTNTTFKHVSIPLPNEIMCV